jgi:hypothetical protein
MKHLETERSAPLSSKSGRRYTTTTIKTFAAVALAAAALTTIDATGNAFAYGRLAGVVQVPNLTKNSGLTGLIPVPKALPNPSPCRRFRSTNRIPSDTALSLRPRPLRLRWLQRPRQLLLHQKALDHREGLPGLRLSNIRNSRILVPRGTASAFLFPGEPAKATRT